MEKLEKKAKGFKPNKKLLEECRNVLNYWSHASGNYFKSDNASRYAAKGRQDVGKAMKALEKGEYRKASPITANLWDAGYDYEDRMGGYTLRSLTLISGVLTGEISQEDFFKEADRVTMIKI